MTTEQIKLWEKYCDEVINKLPEIYKGLPKKFIIERVFFCDDHQKAAELYAAEVAREKDGLEKSFMEFLESDQFVVMNELANAMFAPKEQEKEEVQDDLFELLREFVGGDDSERWQLARNKFTLKRKTR